MERHPDYKELVPQANNLAALEADCRYYTREVFVLPYIPQDLSKVWLSYQPIEVNGEKVMPTLDHVHPLELSLINRELVPVSQVVSFQHKNELHQAVYGQAGFAVYLCCLNVGTGEFHKWRYDR